MRGIRWLPGTVAGRCGNRIRGTGSCDGGFGLRVSEPPLGGEGPLLDKRLEVNTRGETALHGAAERGADTIAQLLVDRGAELNVETKQGFTPLDVAMGKSSLIQLPVPKPTTVSLLRKLGGREGKTVK